MTQLYNTKPPNNKIYTVNCFVLVLMSSPLQYFYSVIPGPPPPPPPPPQESADFVVAPESSAICALTTHNTSHTSVNM